MRLWQEKEGCKRVSVVIPNYNYARYIKKRIWSVVRQTYPIYELIVLDDASTDNSVEIINAELKKIREEYPQLKVEFVQNKHNVGKAMAAWKKGFELASGDFVWIAEADDLCSRRFLEGVMKGFEDPEVVLSYAESMIINKWGVVIAPNFRWSRDKEKTGHYKQSYIKDGKDEIQEIMAIRCTIPNVSGVVIRNDKKFLNYFNEALKYTQVGDWYFYGKILENGKISYNRKALNKFRIHKGSITAGAKKAEQHLREIQEMYKYFENNYKLSNEVKKRMRGEAERVRARM